jgi:hypothetical protein
MKFSTVTLFAASASAAALPLDAATDGELYMTHMRPQETY